MSSGDPAALREADDKSRHHLRHWPTDAGATYPRPSEFTFGVLLSAYCKARHVPGAAVRADELLSVLMSEYERQEEEAQGNSSSDGAGLRGVVVALLWWW